MEIFLIVILLFACYFLGAIVHERDIYRNLRKYGNARNSAWTCDIYSKEMKDTVE